MPTSLETSVSACPVRVAMRLASRSCRGLARRIKVSTITVAEVLAGPLAWSNAQRAFFDAKVGLDTLFIAT